MGCIGGQQGVSARIRSDWIFIVLAGLEKRFVIMARMISHTTDFHMNNSTLIAVTEFDQVKALVDRAYVMYD